MSSFDIIRRSFAIWVYLAALVIFWTCGIETRERHFSVQHYCSVTVSPYDFLPRIRSALQCVVHCAEDTPCTAYTYNNTNDAGCSLFSGNMGTQNTCSSGDPDAERFYVAQQVCLNGGSLDQNNECVCVGGYVGTFCERLMEDCSEGYELGNYRIKGQYWTKPKLAPAAFEIYCQMGKPGISVIMVRFAENINFNRSWQEYKTGFTIDPTTDFYLGNQKIHWLTSSLPQRMVVELSNNTHDYQRYHDNFVMADESENFAVEYTPGSSPQGDMFLEACWPPNVKFLFSTYDRDNDNNPNNNCASVYGAGFWFNGTECSQCNPIGDIYHNGNERLGIPNENFWTPTLGDWAPDVAAMFLVPIP